MKVVLVGAGSAQFTQELIGDLCSLSDLEPFEIALHDVDLARLEIARRLGARVVAATGAPCSVCAYEERGAALDGADVVAVTITVGGQDGIEPDFAIPAAAGLRQTVGDSLGIGGIMRCLRTAPVLLAIAAEMRERCPSALLMQLTNPMAMLCMALHRGAPEIRTIGLCHSVWGTALQLAERCGVPIDEVDYEAAGVNHQAWITRLEHRGRDLYPLIREQAESDPAFRDTVRADILRRFGLYPTESSKHNAEYLPYYLRDPAAVERFGLPVNPWRERRIDNREWFMEAWARADGLLPLELDASGEYGPQIVRALATGESCEAYVNVPNTGGLVPDLPEWGVVEVPATIAGNTITPRAVAPLPPQCAALNRRYLDVCDLAVRAVLEGRPEHVYHAALLDPNASASLSPDAIEAVVAELLRGGATGPGPLRSS